MITASHIIWQTLPPKINNLGASWTVRIGTAGSVYRLKDTTELYAVLTLGQCVCTIDQDTDTEWTVPRLTVCPGGQARSIASKGTGWVVFVTVPIPAQTEPNEVTMCVQQAQGPGLPDLGGADPGSIQSAPRRSVWPAGRPGRRIRRREYDSATSNECYRLSSRSAALSGRLKHIGVGERLLLSDRNDLKRYCQKDVCIIRCCVY